MKVCVLRFAKRCWIRGFKGTLRMPQQEYTVAVSRTVKSHQVELESRLERPADVVSAAEQYLILTAF